MRNHYPRRSRFKRPCSIAGPHPKNITCEQWAMISDAMDYAQDLVDAMPAGAAKKRAQAALGSFEKMFDPDGNSWCGGPSKVFVDDTMKPGIGAKTDPEVKQAKGGKTRYYSTAVVGAGKEKTTFNDSQVDTTLTGAARQAAIAKLAAQILHEGYRAQQVNCYVDPPDPDPGGPDLPGWRNVWANTKTAYCIEVDAIKGSGNTGTPEQRAALNDRKKRAEKWKKRMEALQKKYKKK